MSAKYSEKNEYISSFVKVRQRFGTRIWSFCSLAWRNEAHHRFCHFLYPITLRKVENHSKSLRVENERHVSFPDDSVPISNLVFGDYALLALRVFWDLEAFRSWNMVHGFLLYTEKFP
jgi:hypothetical protein